MPKTQTQTVVKEPRLSMERAAASWAAKTGTPKPHRSTLIRWAVRGVRGKRLKAEAIAGRWYTTESAVEDFLRHVSQPSPLSGDRDAGPIRASQVERAVEAFDCLIAPRTRRSVRKARQR